MILSTMEVPVTVTRVFVASVIIQCASSREKHLHDWAIHTATQDSVRDVEAAALPSLGVTMLVS